MADTVVHDVVSKSDYAAAQKEIGELRQRLEATKEDRVKEQIKILNDVVATRDEEIKTLKTELDNAKASKKDADKALDTVKAEQESIKTKLVEAEKKLDENNKAVTKANRISTLVDKGVDKAEAEKIVDSAATASDELFAVILESHAKLVEANKKVAEAAAKVVPADGEKDKEKKNKEKQAAKADEQKLDGAKVEEEVPLSTDASADTETESVVAGLADFLAQERNREAKKAKK